MTLPLINPSMTVVNSNLLISFFIVTSIRFEILRKNLSITLNLVKNLKFPDPIERGKNKIDIFIFAI